MTEAEWEDLVVVAEASAAPREAANATPAGRVADVKPKVFGPSK